MNINLNHNEIVEALIAHVNNQGFNTEGKSVSVSLTAGRGINGHSASIDIDANNSAAANVMENEEGHQESLF